MILDEFARFFVHAQQAVVFQVCAEDLWACQCSSEGQITHSQAVLTAVLICMLGSTFGSFLFIYISLQGGLKFCLACSHGGDWWWASRMPCAAGMA